MPSEELGTSAYQKVDMEAWMPGKKAWGEVIFIIVFKLQDFLGLQLYRFPSLQTQYALFKSTFKG